ncbi:MAG TPA: hypothetical protein DDZ32_12080 [Gammaproteobacteria bacterium]|nr:hypothetical protein [Gammaproteobacteria bacterium]
MCLFTLKNTFRCPSPSTVYGIIHGFLLGKS